MKIAVVAQQMRQPVPGGIGTYISGLVGALNSNEGLGSRIEAGGHERVDVTLLASKPQRLRDPLASLGKVLRVPFGRHLTLALWQREMLRAPEGFDVFHATSFAFPSLKDGSQTVSTLFVHDAAWRTHPELYPKRGSAWHERSLIRAVKSGSTFMVPSVSTADALIRAGVDSSRLHVIAEGSDHLPLLPNVDDGEFLLTVSTQEPRKNLDRLIEAYARIRPGLPHPWPLYIVGPKGWDRSDGTASVNHGSVAGVEFLGPVSDDRLAELLSRARTFAYVPLVEGFGLPPLEAMRAGIPVVASPVPSVSADNAYLVDPLDVGSIARGLQRLLTDDSIRKQLIASGLNHSGECTWERAADAHLAVWAELLKRR